MRPEFPIKGPRTVAGDSIAKNVGTPGPFLAYSVESVFGERTVMGDKLFFKPAGEATVGRIRLRIRTHKGRVWDYLVQLEVLLKTGWRPVIRCDNAHGFAHEDVLDIDGRVVEKKMLEFKDTNEVLRYAERCYKEDADALIERFLSEPENRS